jgi:hypothetical protein
MAGLLTLPRFADKRILTPTVTGGCAADPTCDVYNIFPAGPAAQVVRGACSNLLPAAARSFEDGSLASFVTASGDGVRSNSVEAAWHGTHSLKFQIVSVLTSYISRDVTALTTAGVQYTFSSWFKGMNPARSVDICMWDDVGGWTFSSYPITTSWKMGSVTKTFNAGSTTRIIVMSPTSAWVAGDYIYYDGLQLTNTAYPLWFCNGDGTAMNVDFSTASLNIQPAGGLSFILCGVVPWVGSDSANHQFFDLSDAATGGLWLLKAAGNGLWLYSKDAAAGLNYRGWTTCPTITPGVKFTIMGTTDTLGVKNLYFNGTATTEAQAGPGLKETAYAATGKLGTRYDNIRQAEGSLHLSLLNRVLTPAEVTALDAEIRT